MVGGVTRHMLPHLSGIPHLHVNRPLDWTTSRRFRVSGDSQAKFLIKVCHSSYVAIFITRKDWVLCGHSSLESLKSRRTLIIVLAWENSRHFATQPLVSLWNDDRGTSAEISSDDATVPGSGMGSVSDWLKQIFKQSEALSAVWNSSLCSQKPVKE